MLNLNLHIKKKKIQNLCHSFYLFIHPSYPFIYLSIVWTDCTCYALVWVSRDISVDESYIVLGFIKPNLLSYMR